jgi:hypothetical protein
MSSKRIGEQVQIETSLLTPCVAKVMRRVWERAMKQTSYQVWLQVWRIRDDNPIAHFAREQAEESDEQRPG